MSSTNNKDGSSIKDVDVESDSSSDSLGAYTKSKIVPRVSSGAGDSGAGGDSSPLPACTPLVGRKSKLGDLSTFNRSLMNAARNSSNDADGVRDFTQSTEDGQNKANGDFK